MPARRPSCLACAAPRATRSTTRSATGCPGTRPGCSPTRLTGLLGIGCPIVATGMGYVSGPGLTSAVSAAGGLGILAAATMSPTDLRNAIKKVRERTGAPFGVNLRADAADASEQVGLII